MPNSPTMFRPRPNAYEVPVYLTDLPPEARRICHRARLAVRGDRLPSSARARILRALREVRHTLTST